MEGASSNKQVRMLKMDEVLPNRFQPRIKFDEQALNELTNSIKTHGVIQPIIVRPLGDKYEIIAGERRYKASTLGGLIEIPAIVVDMNDKESAEVALMENVQRQDLTPIEEAISYKKILDMGYIKQNELASKLGKTQSTVANKLRLLNLSDESQEALLQGKISERHARSLLKIKDFERQDKLLNRIIEERLTVRRTDEEIEKMIDNKEVKDIEVLDFDFANNEVKKEEIPGPLDKYEGLYNIPSAPIVEDKEDEFIPTIPSVEAPKSIFEEEVKEEPKEVVDEKKPEDIKPFTSQVNPGFMDISKIETEATNINEGPKKVSLEDLLRSPDTVVSTEKTPIENDPINSNPTQEKPKEETEEPAFNTGKFFTMVEDDEKEETSFEPKFELNSDEKVITNNIFDIDAIDNQAKEEPKQEESFPQFQLNIENEKSSDLSVPSSPIVETEEQEEIINNPIFEFNAEIPTKPTEDLDKTMSFNPVPLEASKLDDFEMPPLDDNEIINDDNQNNAPVTPKVEEYQPIYEEPERGKEQPVDNNKYGAADLRTVINTIRNCAETIEKYGYVIDTEEFDFEDIYQVIFKVQKKI